MYLVKLNQFWMYQSDNKKTSIRVHAMRGGSGALIKVASNGRYV